MRFSFTRHVLLAIAVIALASPALPQASTSNVRGVVRDQTGASIPNAAVSLSNTATNVVLKTRTNEIGFYMFAGITPGAYRLEVEAAGMQKFEGNLTVQVAQDAVVDAILKVGQAATQISVEDITPMVTMDNPTLGHVLESTRIERLPINGRDIGGLLQTVPGLEGIRAYGAEENSHEFTIDGATAADAYWGGNQRRKPGLDTVQEFKVETNSSSAKYTRPTTIVVSTKSGTNSIHGAAFETHRNNAIGKARTRTDTYSKPPQLIRNEFGANAGGPVFIPKVYNGKNKTFWFFAYEAQRNINPSTRGYQVPTEAMRNGDFTKLMDSQGRLSRLYDPWSTDTQTWSRLPMTYKGQANVIDPARLSPVAKYLFNVTPLPTEPNTNPLVDNNWFGPVPNTRRDWTVTTRVDHTFSDKDRVYVRFGKGDVWVFRPFGSSIPALDGVGNTDTAIAPNKSLAGTYIRTFSPTLFNELLVSFSREYWRDSTGGKVKYADQLGLPNPQGVYGWPGFYSIFGNYSFDTQSAMESNLPTWMIDDHVTKIRGKHELQFGAHIRLDNLTVLPDQQQPQGRHDAASMATSLYDPTTSRTNPIATPFTGSNLANLYLGVLNYGNRFVRPYYHMSGNEYALYFQDNYKVTPRLTLNLGLRWEFWPAMKERDGLITGFDPATKSVVLGASMDTFYRLGASTPSLVKTWQSLGAKFIGYQEAGLPSSLMYSNKHDLGPRLGLAYRAGDGARAFVIRSGYRISYFRTALYTWAQTQRGNVPTYATFWNSLTNSALAPDGLPAYGMRSVPTIVAGVNSKNAVNFDNADASLYRGAGGASYFTKDQPDPRVHDWNLTIEKEVAADTVARVAYVGTHSGNMEQWYRMNDPMPEYVWYVTTGTRLPTGSYSEVARRNIDKVTYGSLTQYRRTGFSNYNGVQLELERRFSKGFGYQLFYNMGNAFAAGGMGFDNATSTVPELNQFLPGAVPTDYDARNRFLNYRRDTSVPKHRVRWNWVAELPFGRGKKFGGNATGIVDKLIGGWQIAGMGNLRSTFFSLPTNIYPNGTPLEVYGYKYPIQDCRSGRCNPGYLWWNGYIPANQVNSVDANGKPNGVMGVPTDYKPAAQPLNPWPANPNRNDPMYQYYGGNTVWVPLKDGTTQRVAYDSNLHPYRNQFLPSVRQWVLDASAFKVIPLGEKFKVRFNADFFNVLNHPGNPNSVGGDGILSVRSSGNSARELQLTLRLSW